MIDRFEYTEKGSQEAYNYLKEIGITVIPFSDEVVPIEPNISAVAYANYWYAKQNPEPINYITDQELYGESKDETDSEIL